MWEIDYTYIRDWVATLDDQTKLALLSAVNVLAQQGPTLGRPLVDTMHGSDFPNMKELRPPSPGQTEIRILFAFDPKRKAILLLGGDKSGTSSVKESDRNKWSKWYKTAIPKADQLLRKHLEKLEDDTESENGSHD